MRSRPHTFYPYAGQKLDLARRVRLRLSQRHGGPFCIAVVTFSPVELLERHSARVPPRFRRTWSPRASCAPASGVHPRQTRPEFAARVRPESDASCNSLKQHTSTELSQFGSAKLDIFAYVSPTYKKRTRKPTFGAQVFSLPTKISEIAAVFAAVPRAGSRVGFATFPLSEFCPVRLAPMLGADWCQSLPVRADLGNWHHRFLITVYF